MTGLDDYLMDPKHAPVAAVEDLENALAPLRGIEVTSVTESDRVLHVIPRRASRDMRSSITARALFWPAIAAAAIAILFGTVQTYGSVLRPWTVVTVPAGARISAGIPAARRVSTGDWIITDAVSSARLNVGLIGRTDIAPGSRVRIVQTSASQSRLALEEGQLHARIWAPPRFFFVETKTALAIDLGCEFTLRAYPDGRVTLRVESGEVELAGAKSTMRVPAGNSATIGADGRSGIPIPAASSASLAHRVFEYQEGRSENELDSLLTVTDSSSTIVLFHLLSEVDETERGKVFDKLATVATIPAGVTREAIMRLDQASLERLRSALSPLWTTEIVPLWKRWWRAAWTLDQQQRAN